ncbi:MAG TPA: (Fe-S)-binding protein [Myxococcota bacterium]|nr:(Fe-S)-binding protein [Myxococcota bacterium]
MLNAIVMTVLLAVALSVFGALMVPRTKLLFKLRRENLFDQIPERIRGMLKFAVGQYRMPRDPVAGFAHIFIYAGFMIVSVATVTHFVHAYAPNWHLWGLGGRAGEFYSVIKDSSELLVLVGVIYGLWRRLKPTPSRVGRSWEGVFVLGMIFTLMVTDFMITAGELIVAGVDGLPWSPGGYLAAQVMAPMGVEAAHLAGRVAYWIHCSAVLVFLNFLPIGKHFHVITGFPNVFFRNLKTNGYVEKIDLENTEKFGIRTTADLTWSMGLDLYSCTECGRCNVFCPTVLTGKPLSHRQLNLDLKAALYEDKDIILSGDKEKIEALPALVDGKISSDTIWACTTCGACEQECPVYIENVPRIIQMRQNKVLMDGDIAPELARAYKGMENNNNPWGIGFDKRDAWAEGLGIPRMADVAAEGGAAPLLYWIGCAGSFDDRNKKITLAMVKILKAAGVPFAILGKEEGCTGDPARRTGNEYLFQALAQANVELLNGYNVKRVLTHCPHCLHTIKAEYPQFGGNYEVVHHTQLIDELLASGKLTLTREVKQDVAWHDSCYLGRYHNIYDAPRNVLGAVPGAKLVELPRNKSRSVCCGAGGGRFWVEENIGERINVHRAKEVASANTKAVGSSCPFCLTMLRDGLNHIGKEDVNAQDVSEIVAQAL